MGICGVYNPPAVFKSPSAPAEGVNGFGGGEHRASSAAPFARIYALKYLKGLLTYSNLPFSIHTDDLLPGDPEGLNIGNNFCRNLFSRADKRNPRRVGDN